MPEGEALPHRHGQPPAVAGVRPRPPQGSRRYDHASLLPDHLRASEDGSSKGKIIGRASSASCILLCHLHVRLPSPPPHLVLGRCPSVLIHPLG